MAKAKATKHTAGELAAKAKAALQNKGGGNAGKADRMGGKVGHAKYKCFVCSVQVPEACCRLPLSLQCMLACTNEYSYHRHHF